MINYHFEPTYDGVHIQVFLCGARVYETVRRAPAEVLDTEASRATLLEAAQPTINALREYFKE